jgi:hypothetical protein
MSAPGEERQPDEALSQMSAAFQMGEVRGNWPPARVAMEVSIRSHTRKEIDL